MSSLGDAGELPFVLGVDAGAVAVSLVEMSYEGEILNTQYAFHNGDITGTLKTLISTIPYHSIDGIAVTNTSPTLLKNARVYDSRIARITAAKKNHPDTHAILTVGGENFSLISFDPEGNYRDLKTNSSCAAGTGSFLDQQARRLNLSGSAELSQIALRIKDHRTPPDIASRCAVFAKTDIVHAQQTGYSLEDICDGICRGLAHNIADLLFSGETTPLNNPILFTGGVARNKAVVKHLEKRIGTPLVTDDLCHVYDAMGACLLYLDEVPNEEIHIRQPDDLFAQTGEKKESYYEPLSLKLSRYPNFKSKEKYRRPSTHTGPGNPVETDIYKSLKKRKTYPVYLGIDIGSTSTKAVLLGTRRRVLAGFYTRTAGRPVNAVQAILETIDDIVRTKDIVFQFKGAGTTGSGRKFIGAVFGADAVLDEITAHAAAACILNPNTDTIIEIGGQDSKFTTLRNGMVTFSQMNTVCAAGTGSFIEEQAEKLGVPLDEFSSRAENVRSPLVSDRCTVFMERDINRLLNKNYTVDEMLAASLFAVRENYLRKVATEGNIGNHVCFQGATAKNKALVAAFEQKLQKPIYVSKYCHLTGALGVALHLRDQKELQTRFKGLSIHNEQIPVRTEKCTLCGNHCRIRIAGVKNEEVAYGFLCGRDYDTHRFIDKNKSGFDPVTEREKAFQPHGMHWKEPFTMGIPAALHLFDELPLWKSFFRELSIPVVTGERFAPGVKLGKKLAGAEFCAPVHAFHGQTRYLSDKADCLFLPIYREEHLEPVEPREPGTGARLRKYCYYTQFASTLVSLLEENEKGIKTIRPLVGDRRNPLLTKLELWRSLNGVLPKRLSFPAVSRAYDRALSFFLESKKRLVEIYRENEKGEHNDIRVVLVGRPYTVLTPLMNKGIPGLFGSLGIKVYFQDMLPPHGSPETGEIEAKIAPLLDAVHWKFASRILEAAQYSADTDGLYPVFITSFKCAPDSFIIEYFKRILDAKGKPYLILQLDDHDSNVGYETRIEAGVRSFRNHAAERAVKRAVKRRERGGRAHLPVNPIMEKSFSGKTLLLPNWDTITAPLLAANLRRTGIDARVLDETDEVIRRSMRMNTGQCIPLNAIVLEFIDYIRKYGLDPGQTVLWMIRSGWACNIGMYPYYVKSLLEGYGGGMERAGVYCGDITFMDISSMVSIHAYFAYLFGGLLRKLGCRIRPYEVNKGETDRVIREAAGIFTTSFQGDQPYLEAVEQAQALFDRIEYVDTARESRPKVAIFGDLYMRDNDVINQDLVRFIEEAGGEVITTPYNEYLKIVSNVAFIKLARKWKYMDLVKFKSIRTAVELLEKKYFTHFEKYVGKTVVSDSSRVEEILARFNIRIEQEGESLENILKLFHIMKDHPDVSLFVQTNPAFCCPALVTEAMARDIERETGVPIVTLTYDGTGTPVNDRIIPYLKYPRKVKPSFAEVLRDAPLYDQNVFSP